jgi:hypothetical protein
MRFGVTVPEGGEAAAITIKIGAEAGGANPNE